MLEGYQCAELEVIRRGLDDGDFAEKSLPLIPLHRSLGPLMVVLRTRVL